MPDPAEKAKEDPHYTGHRDRLRERFILGGAEALADYELLELILFMAIPRRDVKPLAKALIKKFDTLAGVLNAPVAALGEIDGISGTAAITLKSVAAAGHRMLKQELINKPLLNNWTRLTDYCRATMGHETKEHFRLLFLNKKNELIADEIQQSGTVDHTPVYPREIVKRALELDATALILCHNHPSGDTTPSTDDIQMTNAVIDVAKAMGIAVHDHIIVSRKGVASFRAMKLIQ
ncbi:MAG: repair protein RadC [Micavibrio sp.]|nr:repair protein RadC [Micavibrio sp.]